jgi:hypothetical protein
MTRAHPCANGEADVMLAITHCRARDCPAPTNDVDQATCIHLALCEASVWDIGAFHACQELITMAIRSWFQLYKALGSGGALDCAPPLLLEPLPGATVLVELVPADVVVLLEIGPAAALRHGAATCSRIRNTARPGGTPRRALTAFRRTPLLDTAGTGDEALVEGVPPLAVVEVLTGWRPAAERCFAFPKRA